jgi:hypothetical protein
LYGLIRREEVRWRNIAISLIDQIVSRGAWSRGTLYYQSAARFFGRRSSSSSDLPWGTHREDAFIAARQKHPFQKAASLIVEKVFVPSVLHKLRYDHNNAAIGMFLRKIENELNDGNHDKAVRGRQDLELWRLLALRAERSLNVLFPIVVKQLRMLVGLDVQGDHFRGKPGGQLNSLAGNVAPAVDRNYRDGMLTETGRVDGDLARGQHFHGVVFSDAASVTAGTGGPEG